MPKEMIVSLNGREKKIAIIENGRVTEFYIERGEGGQGIVGNIYKGRVMRVLPGMQSAFVDIGLERDAFLYVSDFFDEEEEFERIVVDKKKTEGADDEAAQRAASERIERHRVERERQLEAAHASAEPENGAEEEDEESEIESSPSPVASAKRQDAPAATQPAREATAGFEDEAGGRRGRDKRKRRRGEKPEASESSSGEAAPNVSLAAGAGALEDDGIATPFVASDDSFERVVDEEEAAAENGSMFKDARIQERLTDQTRAVEFDIEPTTTTEVGSLLHAGAGGSAGFERIDDGEAESSGDNARLRSIQPQVAASVSGLVGEVEAEERFAQSQEFQRVSDDEAVEATAGVKKRGKTEAAGRASSKKSAKKGAARTDKSAASEAATEDENANVETSATKKRASKPASKKGAAKGSSKDSAAKASSKRGKKTDAEGEQSGDADADASVTSRPTRGEFARRGGRRRRKPGSKSPDEQPTNGQNGDAEIVADDDSDTHVADVPEVEAAPEPVQEAPPPPPSRPREQSRPRPQSSSSRRPSSQEHSPRESSSRSQSQSRQNHPAPEQASPQPQRGPEPRDSQQRDSQQRDSQQRGRGRETGGGGRGRRERQPTITDLLREGQEILVQIAKEPIAKKGARITSHIALPGRFLVYMPTVEHVGVSRKIESDSERTRLRKLIQAIRAEEDVPSGGFIVRTAGVGITRGRPARRRALSRPHLARHSPRRREALKRLRSRTATSTSCSAFCAISSRTTSPRFAWIQRRGIFSASSSSSIDPAAHGQPRQALHARRRRSSKTTACRLRLIRPSSRACGSSPAAISSSIRPRRSSRLTSTPASSSGAAARGSKTRSRAPTWKRSKRSSRQIRLRDLGGIIVLDLIDMEERRNRAARDAGLAGRLACRTSRRRRCSRSTISAW